MSTTPSKDPPVALSLLARAHSPDTASRIHTEKVIQRPLHLKPTTPSNAQLDRRAARLAHRQNQKRKRALKPKPLSSRQRKALCLYEVPRPAQRHEMYVPLHELWVKYIQGVLGLTNVGGEEGTEEKGKRKEKRYVTTGDAAKLCAADFHGAEVEVVRSRCVGRVGIKGIVVKDGRGAFDIVTRDGDKLGADGKPKGGALKRVPKEGTWFAFEIPLPGNVEEDGEEDDEMDEHKPQEYDTTGGESDARTKKSVKFELHGDQFIYRAADRANRKFKPHYLKNI